MVKIEEIYKLVSKHMKQKNKLSTKIYKLTKKLNKEKSKVAELESNLKEFHSNEQRDLENSISEVISSKHNTPQDKSIGYLIILIMMTVSYVFLKFAELLQFDHTMITVNMLSLQIMIMMTYWII